LRISDVIDKPQKDTTMKKRFISLLEIMVAHLWKRSIQLISLSTMFVSTRRN